MNMVATESGTETGPDSDQTTDVALDVNLAFEQASSLIDLSHPGTTLSPLEPSTNEPSRDAKILVGTGELSALILLVDGTSELESFNAADVIAALVERLSETMSLELHALEDATESQLEVLSDATTFRTSLTSPDADMGELRFAVATLTDAQVEEMEDVEGSSETADDATTATPSEEPDGSDESAVPDAASLAERLPNLAAVDMNVSVELGRVKMPIRDLLGLGTGSVIRLGTPVGESFDILVNGKAAARGDLVVVGGRLAVRIRELLGVDA